MVTDTEVVSLWSKRTTIRRRNQGAASEYRKPYEAAMVDALTAAERAVAQGEFDPEAASILRAHVSRAVHEELFRAGAPRQSSLRRYVAECRADRTLLDPFPDSLPNSDALVLLAAEWAFAPVGEGVVLATRERPATTWVDIRSGLHAIWWWAAEHNVGLGRALGAILRTNPQAVAFRPFLGLFDRLLDLHSFDAASSSSIARCFAVLAGEALIHVEAMRTATEFLIRPALVEARALGIGPEEEERDPASAEAVDEEIANLLFALEAARDRAEQDRIRLQIGRLLTRLRHLDADEHE